MSRTAPSTAYELTQIVREALRTRFGTAAQERDGQAHDLDAITRW